MNLFRMLPLPRHKGSESLTAGRPDVYPESIRYIVKYGIVGGEGVGNDYYSISWSDLKSFVDNDYHNEIIYFSCKRAADLFSRGSITQEMMQRHIQGLYTTLQLAQDLYRQHPNETFSKWSAEQIASPIGLSPDEEYCRVQKLKVISYLGPNAYFRRLSELPEEFELHNANNDHHPVLVANSMYLGVLAWVRNLAATGQSFSMLDPKTGVCYGVSSFEDRLLVDWGRIAGGDKSLCPVLIDDIYRTGKSVEKARQVLSQQGFTNTNSAKYLTGFILPT